MSGNSEDVEGEQPPARNDTMSHVLYVQELVGDDKKDSAIIDLMCDQFKQENAGSIAANQAIASIGPANIIQVVIGPKYVGILLKDGDVCRIPYNLLQIQSGEIKESETTRSSESSRIQDVYARGGAGEVEVIPLSGGLSSIRAATGQAKYRRVMLTNRAYYRLRGGIGDARSYILGAPRPPAANVPEDLINQVQQVLQGKSRDVITRELQRTGLNVNEAVNNLLSRDDGDDQDMDMGGEHLIPEELLQILEGGVPPGTSSGVSSIAESFLEREERLLDSLSARGAELRYTFGGSTNSSSTRKAKTNDKEKKKKEPETNNWRNCMQLDEDVEWWCGNEGGGVPLHVRNHAQVEKKEGKKSPVLSITATSFAMYVLHKNGLVYSWPWDELVGRTHPMQIAKNSHADDAASIGTFEDPVVQMSSSNLRITVITRKGHVVTWLDENAMGVRAAMATEAISKIPEESVLNVRDLVTSDHLSAFRIDSIIHWCGIIPLLESTRSYEKGKEDKKKHVSFGETTVTTTPSTSNTEFAVGQHVQMKKAPLYPAGSVAAKICLDQPMIGVLLEDCWNATDMCRFRCMTPTEYDFEMNVDGFESSLSGFEPSESFIRDSENSNRMSRKRPLLEQDDEHYNIPPPELGRRKIDIWHADDLVWIHEHRKRDLMRVQVVDNNLVAVKYLPNTGQTSFFQSIFSDRLEMEGLPLSIDPVVNNADWDSMRLLRKEDLQIVDKCPPRAPVILQRELLKFDVDSNRTIVSMVADLNELRVLARSKHAERGMHLYRVSTTGKVISRRRVPVYLPSVERPIPDSAGPELISFGDPRTLFLRDTAGQLIPLQRDALNGFREPPAMHSQPIRHIATACRPITTSPSEKNCRWQGSMLVIPGIGRPWHSLYIQDGSPLMQMVLYCDLEGVINFLDRIHDMRMNNTITNHEFRKTMNEQLFIISSDLCSNVLHAAIRLTGAQKNAEDCDKAHPDTQYPELFATRHGIYQPQEVVMEEETSQGPPTDEAGTSQSSYIDEMDEEEGRWSRVLRSRPNRGPATPLKKRKERRATSEDIEEPSENVIVGGRSELTGMPFGSIRPQEGRQRAALQIVETLLSHPAMFYGKDAGEEVAYENEERLSSLKALLVGRDLSGMTPFQSAINQRAYGAAYSIWRALLQLDFRRMSDEEKLKYIFPSFSTDESHNADDSPLFILCYNDVCSFTWTGEDHINQDIYECKTCGLTGSLCCCSECALTCHRNHDCRLKRTSPTAYCDCWEKSSCKALIAGNEILRDYLLGQLLTHTRLYEYPNARNEHVVLFLARTVIRQTREQTYSQKRRGRYRHVIAPTSTTSGTPEHNLQPPKFAKTALEHCCKNPNIVMNSLKCGTGKHVDYTTPSQLHFVLQGSAAHIDKLTFAMSNKHLLRYSTMYISTLQTILSGPTPEMYWDSEIENWVGRFVRSLVRVLTLAINVSPLAPSTILAAEEPMEELKDPRDDGRSRMHPSASYQMFHALVLHKKESSKLSEKSASFVAMVNRIMQILQQLPTFAVVQLAIAADAVFEPVRDGMLKPMVNPALAGSTNDPIDILEKYFVSDLSFVEVLKKSKKEEKMIATANEKKRIRRGSRRDTDRENGSDNQESMEDERSAGDRASESHETARVRHDSAATSTVATPRRRRLLSGNTTNDTNDDNEERTGQQRDPEAESSSSDDDDDDDDEGEDDDDDDDDDNDDDDDEDSDRQAEERPEGDERDGDDDEQEQEEEALNIEMRRNEAAELAAIVEDAVPMVHIDREDEGDWDPYPAESPRRNDFDDNSSDSQEGGPREPPIAGENQRAEEANGAEASNIARPVAEHSGASSRSRQRLGTRDNPFGVRQSEESRGQARIDRYLPYRLPPRSNALSRREDSTNSSSNNAASSNSGIADQAPSGSSTAPASNSTSQNRSSTQTTSSSGSGNAPSNQEAAQPPPPKKSPEHTDQPSLETAREQLALTFSVLVRAGCDILSRMTVPVQTGYSEVNENAKRSQLKAQKIFGDILQETFRWMGRVFESTEARINFNEAYEKSLYRPVSPGPEDKKGRKEALSYIHSLLRLATDEGKDALANVEVELLYPVGFVADAYFYFLNCNAEKPIELKQIVDTYEDLQRRHFREQCESTDMDLMIGFFMRPASLSWPGHLHDGAWDTLSGRHHTLRALKFEEECPMVGGPKILTMTSKAEELFREPNIDDVKRKTSSYKNDPVEEYTYNILDRPFEYRSPGASLAIVPHRRKQEKEFISITRDFYHRTRTPDNEVKNFSTNPERFPGYVGKVDDAVSKFKDMLLIHSCEREQLFFSKWHKTLSIIGGRFYDKLAEALGSDVAFERSVLLRKLASFETKYQLFNKATEKLRAQHSTTKEIILDVRREPGGLFRDTMVQLHGLYAKRMTSVRSLETPLAGTKLRVHFIDEPGEGSGVTRSFYTAFAECCMGDIAPFAPESTHEKSLLIQSVLPPKKDADQDAFRRARREQAIRLKNHLRRLRNFPVNLNASRFDMKEYTGENDWTTTVLRDTSRESRPANRNYWGHNEAVLRKIHTVTTKFLADEKIIGRVMGIMCQLPKEMFTNVVDNDDSIRLHIQSILAELRAEGELEDSKILPWSNMQTRSDEETFSVLVGTEDPMDKLFEKAPYGECYVPKIGNGAPMRIAAYRTVGRIMGICLAQGDIFPMRFSRHVFSFILKEPICWLDLGFYDPTLFNNLRLLMQSDFKEQHELDNDFTFWEEKSGNLNQLVDLKPNGANITVNKDNVVEFVYKYTERVLVGKRISALEAIREGILDVIPECILDGLTPEDLRLIICGIESVSISVLQENTSFLDESRASQEILNRFKQWFWQVIEAFTPQEKQDLVFFWTGSPSLPATGKWQSSASVMLRPQEDIFLPTANTCISRIYVPVYSSKRMLRSKLLVAIKARNFGFV